MRFPYSGFSIIIDGVSPFNGPAPIFYSPWDLKGALMTKYGFEIKGADILKSGYKFDDNGLQIHLFNWKNYPYDTFLIYNNILDSTYVIKNSEQMRKYRQEISLNKGTTFLNPTPGLGYEIF